MDGYPLTFLCPACGERGPAANKGALARLRQEGLCQGCRARRSLEQRPELLSLLISFWRRSGFPASSSWLEAAGERPIQASVAAKPDCAALVRH